MTISSSIISDSDVDDNMEKPRQEKWPSLVPHGIFTYVNISKYSPQNVIKISSSVRIIMPIPRIAYHRDDSLSRFAIFPFSNMNLPGDVFLQ